MTEYVETKIQITNIVDMSEHGSTSAWIVMEFKELEDDKPFFHQRQTLHIKKENFTIPYKGNISKLVGKQLKLVLRD